MPAVVRSGNGGRIGAWERIREWSEIDAGAAMETGLWRLIRRIFPSKQHPFS